MELGMVLDQPVRRASRERKTEMPTISLDELREKIPSKFNLVMVAAKRARQIKDGAPKLVHTQSVNPVTIALEEVAAGKIYMDGDNIRILDDFPKPTRAEVGRDLGDLLSLPAETADETDGSDAMARLLKALEASGEPLDEEVDGA